MTDHDTGRVPLKFETDKGASRSIWIALLLLLLVVGWMASSIFLAPPAPEDSAAAEILPPRVLVRESHAGPVTLNFRAEGQAQPDRDTAVRVETSGTVIEVLAEKGTDIEAGWVIAHLSSDHAEATLEQAREELVRAQREFDNASQLRERGVATSDRVSEARADLASAQAQVTAAEVALDDLTVLAPFSGRIETLPINEGEFVAAGEEVARLVDNDPLTVTIQVPQQSLNRIRTGQMAKVQFITGQERDGVVSFVGTAAEAATRTFLAEIEIDNPDGAIPAGISAEITIPTGEEQAHFIEPSIVSLDPEGNIGVKIEEDGIVRFVPIEVADAQQGGFWATGLPETARIVTIGQGFVRDGEAVRAQLESEVAGAGEAAAEAAESDIDTSAMTANDVPGSAEMSSNLGPGQ
ncbi:MAG TPA: efflux RND transporter periplasmic adaptor subunit [Paracoccus sp. (in: a-proteobacteria)]|uniref:efflux RND transporter periplasmic adaptor subunit n=1 Tax=uncultured Paracoccus sp. TaxID=189685 RepID=UPI00262DDCB0|nr:efflux RND transporter periplasmic adaptor subunit [uncultured Paracoccus sp.]HMQ39686.1 efflux RND transporter periplasmic adaptor subunit [Paracoccus sp. (in: a-proteobacteria)]HMR34822.1 efflux RND transporter periplasmic adaptor subunit [Paracoccus sp. (in: a-proteobacteria)]